MVSMNPLESSQADLEEVHIKFTGDGTFVGKRLHVGNVGMLMDSVDFNSCVCGIGAANSDFACIWCTCPKSKRDDQIGPCLIWF